MEDARASSPRFPGDVVRDVVYACSGPRVGGVGFSFRLPFWDETRHPASYGWFNHGWVISRADLELAEERRAVDQLILELRAAELRRFLGVIERRLARHGAALVRVRRELVLRRRSGT